MGSVDVRVRRWADTLVHYCLDVQPGEVVAIISTPLAEPLIQEVYRMVLQAGGHPFPVIGLPRLRNTLLSEGSDEQVTWRSPLEGVLASEIDKRLRISAEPNPLALANIAQARQALASAPSQVHQRAKANDKSAEKAKSRQIR